MKKILIFGVVGLALAGCTDSKTGLKNEVINQHVDACITSLKESLKSPSSLKMLRILANYEPATVNEVYFREFYDLDSINDVTNKYSVLNTVKYQPRTLKTIMEYEAQNSFGAMLKGYYGCTLVGNGNSDNDFAIIPEGENEDEDKLKSLLYSPKESFWYKVKAPSSAQGVKIETSSFQMSASEKQKKIDAETITNAMKKRMNALAEIVQLKKTQVVENERTVKRLRGYRPNTVVSESYIREKEEDLAKSKKDLNQIMQQVYQETP